MHIDRRTEAQEGFRIATAGSVACIVTDLPMTADHVVAMEAAYQALKTRYGRFATFTLSSASRPGVSDDARARLKVLTTRYHDVDVGDAVVMSHTGFQATIVRAIVGSITLIAGGNIKVCADIETGLLWLGEVARIKKLEGFNPQAIREALTHPR